MSKETKTKTGFDPDKGFFPEPVERKPGAHKGRPKPKNSGRKPGTKNTRTLLREAGLRPLREQLERFNFDPVRELIKMHDDSETDAATRLKILEMICDRMYPKLAAMKVEVNADKAVMPGQSIIQAAADETVLEAIEQGEAKLQEKKDNEP